MAERIFKEVYQGRGSPDTPEKPHTYTIGRKFWFPDNGGCTITGISRREKRHVDERLKAYSALSSDNEISIAMEVVSFDDTLGEIGRVANESLSEDRVIPFSSVEMYEVIADCGIRPT